ncbi:hypothetical protein KIPB_016495, partial [Kipferlia bialata]
VYIVTADLDRLNLSHLIGTELLAPHGHGFYISGALLSKVETVANPAQYKEWREARIEEEV